MHGNILSLLEEGAITLADLHDFSDDLKDRMAFIMEAMRDLRLMMKPEPHQNIQKRRS